jgi:hypothetical protein
VIIALFIIYILTLAWIAFEDFRYLGVNWLAFPTLFILSVLYTFFSHTIRVEFLLFNIGIIVLQMGGIALYFFFKYKTLDIINTKIGLGDILFLIAITPLFHPIFFVLFLLLSLISTLIFLLNFTDINKHVPLAGYLSIMLILLLIGSKIFNLNFLDPIYIIQLIP